MAKLLQLVTNFMLITLISVKGSATWNCPYGRPEITYKNEVFAFMTASNHTFWDKLPWDQLTTLGLFINPIPDSLICLAHKHQVRIIHAIDFGGSMLENSTACQEYIKTSVNYVKEHNIDGLNIDFEEAISNDSPRKLQLTNFVANLSKALHQAVPGSKLSYDLPFSPDGTYGRNYDAVALSKSLDYIVIMAYDEAQGPYANANSGYDKSHWGVKRYMDIGVPASKLIIAFPWYGYSYPCSYISPNHVCSIKAGGHQVVYKDMEQYYEKYSTTSVMWDETALSPFFDVKINGVLGQVRYDDPKSLRLKNDIALTLRLLGVGMWTANSGDFPQTNLWEAMWATMPYRKNEVVLETVFQS